MRKIVGLFFIIFIVVMVSKVSFAEQKKLSREQAAKILKQKDYGYIKGQFPAVLPHVLDYGDENESLRSQAVQEYQDLKSRAIIQFNLRACVDNGLINFREDVTQLTPTKFNVRLYIDATDKLKPFIVSYNGNWMIVKLYDVVFDKVTGIVKLSTDLVRVEFTTKVKNTVLSGIIPLSGNMPDMKHSAIFQLYDDGWRFRQQEY